MGTARFVAWVVVAGALGGCLSDQWWEGTATRCTRGGSFDVILLLDGPVGPNPKGQFGYALQGRGDTFAVAPLEGATNLPGQLKFDAVFDDGAGSTRWRVDLKKEGPTGDYDGEVEQLANSNTIRCDVRLSPH